MSVQCSVTTFTEDRLVSETESGAPPTPTSKDVTVINQTFAQGFNCVSAAQNLTLVSALLKRHHKVTYPQRLRDPWRVTKKDVFVAMQSTPSDARQPWEPSLNLELLSMNCKIHRTHERTSPVGTSRMCSARICYATHCILQIMIQAATVTLTRSKSSRECKVQANDLHIVHLYYIKISSGTTGHRPGVLLQLGRSTMVRFFFPPEHMPFSNVLYDKTA